MSEKRLVVFALNYRNMENIAPLLKSLADNEWKISIIAVKNKLDLSAKGFEEFSYNILNTYDVDPHKDDSQLRQKILEENSVSLKKSKLVLLPDVQNFPSSSIYWGLKKINKSIKIIGFQHGLYQRWTKNFLSPICDFYFAFGERSKSFFPKYRQDDLIVAGLPKLDSYEEQLEESGDYILFLGQNTPGPEKVKSFLEQLSVKLGLKVLVRNHPQYPDFYKVGDEFKYEIETHFLMEQIKGASFVLTSHSTCIIEALRINKAVVILPDEDKEILQGIPSVMRTYSVEDCMTQLESFKAWNYKTWANELVVNFEKSFLSENVDAIEAIAGFKTDHSLYLKSKKQNKTILKNIILRSLRLK